MSKRKNSKSQDTDAVENENIESEIDHEAAENPVEEQTDKENIDDEVIAEIDDVEDQQEELEQMEVDKADAETEQDQGFDRQPAPVAASNSGGKGMAGTAMVMSLLALAGTGYNWYDTKSLKATQSQGDEQAAVDYSQQIAGLEQQIQSLTESQQALSAMADLNQAEPAEDDSAAMAAADESAEQAEAVAEEITAAEQTEESQESTEQVSETSAVESDEQTAASTEPEVAESEATDESEAIAVTEETTQASSSDTEAAGAVMPTSDDIKQIAIEQVDAVLADAKKRLGLNEVAQLLSIGEQRLSLAGDVTGAQTAFGIADQRLAAFADPMIDPVRESIASNIESLNAVEIIDKNALTQDLGSLASAVDTLAFKPLETLADEESTDAAAAEEVTTETAGSGEETQSDGLSVEGAGNLLKSWGAKLGNTIGEVGSGIAGDLKNMVRIKKTGAMSDVVLAPEQEYFIRENMKLMLGGAQRAVLQNNTGVYQQNITQAQSLLGDFFDPDNEEVQSVANRLTGLAQINLEPELPDISNSSASLSEVLDQLASGDSNN